MGNYVRSALGLLVLSLALPALSIEFAKIERHAKIVMPSGAGPFPVVFLISGCGGFGASYDNTQSAWATKGLMTVRIDLVAANKVSTCRDLSTEAAITDTISAIKQLSQSRYVKPDAINIMGVSWGGAIALAALSDRLKVDAVVALFPACRFTDHLTPTAVTTPVLVLHGEADITAPLTACRETFEVLENLKLITFPGAPHSFLGMRRFKSETKRARDEYQAFFHR